MKHIVSKAEAVINHDHKQEEREELYLSLSSLWISAECCENLSVNNKFNYGKHGPKELVELFSRIGIDDVFEYVDIFEQKSSFIEDYTEKIKFKDEFASFVNYRNKIIHQDFTPELTHVDILNYKEHFVKFSDALGKKLILELDRIVIIQEMQKQTLAVS